MDSHCEEAVRSAIVRSVRRESKGTNEVHRFQSKPGYYFNWY